ncbi:MAG: hypothetical protein ACM3XN_06550 [Chloroflexota bacterium]
MPDRSARPRCTRGAGASVSVPQLTALLLTTLLMLMLLLMPPAAASCATAPSVVAAPPTARPDRSCSPPGYGLWRIWNWHEEAVWTLTADRPRALEVTNTRSRPGPGALTVTVTIANLPAGATPRVTLMLTHADGAVREQDLPLAVAGRDHSGTLLVPDFGGQVKRVVATAALARAGEGAAADGAARCLIAVRFAPGAPGATQAAAPQPDTAQPPPDATDQPQAATLHPLASQPALSPAPPPPQIRVRRITRQTSSRQEDRTHHALWLWSFGDGTAYPVAGAANVVSTQVHPFVTPGLYTVTARSVSNKGTLLRELSWPVVVPPPLPGVPPVPLIQVFSAETIREPDVKVIIAGPQTWVVGRPADFTVSVEFADPPHCNRGSVLVDPGREFTVVWDKPGMFTVRAAATVHLRYEFPERVITVVNTYVAEQEVEVFATVNTD